LICHVSDQHAQQQHDSAEKTWTNRSSQKTKIDCVRDFYLDMHSRDTLPTSHCVVCNTMQPENDMLCKEWRVLFPENSPLFSTFSAYNVFSCGSCFPTEGTCETDICHDCLLSLEKSKIPDACRVNNLSIGCSHQYPQELLCLTPLEERLLARSQSSGWIIKLEIHPYKTNTDYRKLQKGHISVFPKCVQDLASNVLPHPGTFLQDKIAVCFIGPRQPPPEDVAFMLAVRPAKIHTALQWLKQHNPLLNNIIIS
ncbi:hypothetical protein DFS34DRAFT_576435, partial [Phlyctochytrium arcticum]